MKSILSFLIISLIALSPIPALAATYEDVTITVLDAAESPPPASEEEITITVLDAQEPLPPNQEEITITVVDESQPPTGTIKINNDSPATNSTTVILNLSAQDDPGGSGLDKMQFSNDNSDWLAPEAYFTTKSWDISSGDGEKTVYVKFSDKAENWSSVSSDRIILDTLAPVTTESGIDGSWHNGAVTVSLSSTDAGSGVDKTYYSIHSAEVSPAGFYTYTGPFTISEEGTYTIKYYSTDKAGNAEALKPASNPVKIDKTPPAIVITSPRQGEVIEETSVRLEGTIDGKVFSEVRELTTEGENTLTKTAVDLAGNTGSGSVTLWRYLGQSIGEDGGTVLSPDGKIKLIIPQGALNKGETKQIRVLSVDKDGLRITAKDKSNLLSVAECKPLGTRFNKDVSLIYTLSQAEIPGTPVELGFYNSWQKKIIPTGKTSIVPADGYTLNFAITHFSTYAALKGFVSPGNPIGQGVKIPLPDMLTGSFSHSIPLTVPPGRKGMQPNLGLSYRSSNPNSWLGVGFSLNPGYIVRSTRLGPPKYKDEEDTFYFVTEAGTTELVHLIDNLYQAKVESSFTKFFKESDDSWRAVSKDGSVLRFGSSDDPDAKEGFGQNTFAWYLTRAIDTNGNYIKFAYIRDQGKSYLSRIDYTGNENEQASFSPTNSVEFILDSREDISSSYISGAKIATFKRLKQIEVKVNSDLVWRYELAYAYSEDTNRSLLKSVTQYGSDGKSLPKQRLEYQKAK